ncbi:MULTISPECIES: DUF1761 domain-containing protein [unclassified Mucilaginibacter]|uniref:DUF1761 domain-containing protein n=1 Tax=unclassified Mucilaginibacter TaxID=2617802 RepID=UPI002AC9C28E|nr:MULTISPECIES: DUF1761 domain-containing protein [unclassified Mucilaginibacter]MEB0263589.1 DUF1761 domain-containing protein [Mucilaginibacter sp. 10I4]MEB0280751.1 DUF1761 domain-containing protein [Mucilaginibacter sp. 10B2]MEB0301468.1 DUF1761 domain-containing protein [Mucilaginibacter sp. 5C4]WPX22660.1 DUF1761 domain-containing protein [Mucilaginibacter sp. 5C4]
MDASLINWPAVAVAGLSGFAVGGIWYAPPVFGKVWMADSNNGTVTKRQQCEDLWFHVLFSLIMAANLAAFLADAKTDVAWGTTAGFLAGIWTFFAIATASLFELKSWRYIYINGGYSVASLTIIGAILGAWR